jgi:hypothetical protein
MTPTPLPNREPGLRSGSAALKLLKNARRMSHGYEMDWSRARLQSGAHVLAGSHAGGLHD